jgi:hypothetical protein
MKSPLAGALLAAALATACSVDRPEGLTDVSHSRAQALATGAVTVCHDGDEGPALLSVAEPALGGHRRHGDYVAGLVVDGVSAGDDGVHFARITDALAAARGGRLEREELETAKCRITITVAAGTLPATTVVPAGAGVEQLPLVIDVPDITVRGALVMDLDDRGRALGTSAEATTIAPSPWLVLIGGCTSARLCASEPIFIVNGHPAGSKGHGAIIEGFAFQSGRAASDTGSQGVAVLGMRVNDLTVRGNRFEGGFSSGVDLRGVTGLLERNHLDGIGSSCDFCLAGPGTYTMRDSRILGGGIPGVLILPFVLLPVPPQVEPYPLPAAATVTASVINNEVRNHRKKPVGVGLRVGAIGVDASDVIGTANVTFTDNDLVNNTFGIIIEAAFVRAGTPRRGDITLSTSGNTITSSCQTDVLVTLTNSQTGLGIGTGPALLNSTYNLTLSGDIDFDQAWYAHPAGQGNTLIVNGQPIANGIRRAFDPNKVCAP